MRDQLAEEEPSLQRRPARDVWSVDLESMSVAGEHVYAITIHRKGAPVHYLHCHYRSRSEAEAAYHALTRDLALDGGAFESKYALDTFQ